MKKVKYTALSGMAIALTVVLMSVTAVLPVLMYVLPIATGLMVLLVSQVAGKGYAMGVFTASAILSLIFVSDKESVLAYLLFFGYYPLIKDILERLPKALSVIVKVVVFNCAAVLIGVAGVYVFGISGEEYSEFGKWTIPVLLVLANIVFVLYDRLITKNNVLLQLCVDRIKKFLR